MNVKVRVLACVLAFVPLLAACGGHSQAYNTGWTIGRGLYSQGITENNRHWCLDTVFAWAASNGYGGDVANDADNGCFDFFKAQEVTS